MKEKLEKYKNLYNLIQTSLKDANEGIQKIQVQNVSQQQEFSAVHEDISLQKQRKIDI